MKIFDAHADTPTRLLDKNKSLTRNDLHIDFERLSKNKSVQAFAVFCDPKYKDTANERVMSVIENFIKEAEKCKIHLIKNIADIEMSDGVTGIITLENGDVIQAVCDVDKLKNLGIMMIAPTWNFRNHLACGVLEEEDTGLTDFGEKVIKRMNELGILIDVSHLSEKSFWDVCKLSQKPVCASHSNSKTVCNHPRNLTDEQFLKIHDMNGCVGINFYPPFLGDNISCVVNHINHFLSLGGEDNIGIGSDFDGVDSLPLGIEGCQDMEKVIKMLPYSTKVRKKIAYENFLRVLRAQNC